MEKFYSNVDEIEIENSSICNAACPQCVREFIPGNHSWFEEKYLSVDFFENHIPVEIYQNLKSLLFSGSIGDPCTAPNFLDVIKTVRSKGNFRICVNTNGGMKNPEWWRKLASLLGPEDAVQFALDGLEDTNHIYRVNVKWSKVIENASAFIESGGNAYWQFVVFKHNQHQVEQAKTLSAKLGFKTFIAKPSHRFALDNLLGIQRIGSGGVLLEPTTLPEYLHIVMKSNPVSIDEWFSKSNNSCINCYAKKTNTAYIDSRGHLFPCCYLSGNYYARLNIDFPDNWTEFWSQFGADKINLHNYSWNEIVEGSLFEEVERRWNADYKGGRLSICASTCSEFENRLNDLDYTKNNKQISNLNE